MLHRLRIKLVDCVAPLLLPTAPLRAPVRATMVQQRVAIMKNSNSFSGIFHQYHVKNSHYLMYLACGTTWRDSQNIV